jgi:hypothetical protein
MTDHDDLVLRALQFYNTGKGLTRGEIVAMAKTVESLRAEVDRLVAENKALLREAVAGPATPDEAQPDR